jgi:hypothetical protein
MKGFLSTSISRRKNCRKKRNNCRTDWTLEDKENLQLKLQLRQIPEQGCDFSVLRCMFDELICVRFFFSLFYLVVVSAGKLVELLNSAEVYVKDEFLL